MENASCQYVFDEVKRTIEMQKKGYGWEFLLLGANMDAVSMAGRFGIVLDRAVTFENDSQDVATNYRVEEEALSFMRSASIMSEIDGTWKNETERDFKSGGHGKIVYNSA